MFTCLVASPVFRKELDLAIIEGVLLIDPALIVLSISLSLIGRSIEIIWCHITNVIPVRGWCSDRDLKIAEELPKLVRDFRLIIEQLLTVLSLHWLVNSQEILRGRSLSIEDTEWVRLLLAEMPRLIRVANILSLCNWSGCAQRATLLILIVLWSLLLEHGSSEVGTQVSFRFLDVISRTVSVSAVELVRRLELSCWLELGSLISHLTLFL